MKTLIGFMGIFLLFAVVGFQGNLADAKINVPGVMLDECSLSSSEIEDLQQALADEEEFEFSFVVSHTIDISYTSCDGSLATAGTITLDIGNVPQVWNWTIERLGGGDNIIVIWPA